jgi:hypothetical protein
MIPGVRLAAVVLAMALSASSAVSPAAPPACPPPPSAPPAPLARPTPLAHPNSFSSSFVLVQGAEVALLLRVQAASLLEVLPDGTDADGDGLLQTGEVDAARAGIAEYVARHYVLRAGGGDDPEAGTVLAGELDSVAFDEPVPGLGADEQWIELTLRYLADAPLHELSFDVTLFLDTSPTHRDLCRIRWNELPEQETMFHLAKTGAHFSPEAVGDAHPVPDARAAAGAARGDAGVAAAGGGRLGLSGWVSMGVDHILTGWDHMAFVVALIVSAGRVGALLWVVTAFTLAHSLTLALAALGVVTLSGRPVELTIAFSIAWVGVAAARARAPVARWPEAFVFGLVHGLGFAGFLGEALAGTERRLVPLLGFNLGVELGQLSVVAGVLVPLVLLRASAVRRARAAGAPPPRHAAWLAPPAVRLPVAAAVALAGAWWFLERTGWT